MQVTLDPADFDLWLAPALRDPAVILRPIPAKVPHPLQEVTLRISVKLRGGRKTGRRLVSGRRGRVCKEQIGAVGGPLWASGSRAPSPLGGTANRSPPETRLFGAVPTIAASRQAAGPWPQLNPWSVGRRRVGEAS